jgi:hypothetical protein
MPARDRVKPPRSGGTRKSPPFVRCMWVTVVHVSLRTWDGMVDET